jgi:hypothetical protein
VITVVLLGCSQLEQGVCAMLMGSKCSVSLEIGESLHGVHQFCRVQKHGAHTSNTPIR